MNISEFLAQYDLSQRQRQCLELALKGNRNREIAEKMALSVRTVESHLNSAYQVLDVQGEITGKRTAVLQRWLATHPS